MSGWYLISYDIRDERRLCKFHYRLSKSAMALQESVFLVKVDAQRLKRLEKLVKAQTHTDEDDVRLYPVSHPNALWTAGKQPSVFDSVFSGKVQEPVGPFRHFLRNIFGRSQ